MSPRRVALGGLGSLSGAAVLQNPNAAGCSCTDRRRRSQPSKTTADDRDWRKCNNPICRDMVTIIDRAAVNEAVITQFQFERIRLSKAIMLQPMHGKLRIYMQEADEVKAEASRIILP